MAISTGRRATTSSGLLPSDPFLESYWVRAGGATVVVLDGDDRLTIRDPAGGQVAELTAFAPDGRDDAAAIGASADAPATVLRALMASEADGAPGVVAALATRGIDPSEAPAVRLFGASSSAGAEETFVAQRPVVVVIAAPEGASVLDGGMPGSDLDVEVRRTHPRAHDELELPPPLAEPRLDFRIDRASALSYEVKAGEYIQIIDVEGKQCSDFLAFHKRKLEDGIERGFDPTITRTLMGNAFPMPGLYSKFFDLDMDVLVEVVRDTVGRHDSFLLACTSRYYENLGYFGHTNCTDNFNRQLETYAIAPRKGWQALNFFYNTMFAGDHQLVFDEPWSRPGDYVLLRAATDLVCASSACPDDVDPANGWDPTEVHVRVYSPEHRFSAAIAHRVTPDAEPTLTTETGFHPRTSALTNRTTEYNGYWLPTSYDNHGATDEYWSCRERAAIMDLSPLRKFEVLGPDAEALLQATVTRDVRRLSDGHVVYTAMTNETGGMIDDATIFRIADTNYRFVGGSEYDGIWLREQAERLGLNVFVKESTHQLHNVAVQGPASRELLREVVWTPPAQTSLDALEWFRFSVGRIGGSTGVPAVISRTGYTGELGYEIFCHPKDALAVWDAVWEAGKPHDLAPLGLEALDLVRIEAGLIFFGYEFSDQTDPFEAGIGFTVALKGNEEFIGRDALLKRKEHPQRVLVGLELDGGETADHGDCVHQGRAQVGVVTSGMKSPLLKKSIALCRMDVNCSALGTEVEIGKLDGHQKRIPGRVVRFPFYDPEKARVRS